MGCVPSNSVVLGLVLGLFIVAGVCHGASNSVFQVIGAAECADCQAKNINPAHAFLGLGVTVECKLGSGEVTRRGHGEMDKEGNFKVVLPNGVKDKEECYAHIHGAAGIPCSDVAGIKLSSEKMILKPANKIKLSSDTCTSAFLWPYYKFPKWFHKPILSFPPHKGLSFPPIPWKKKLPCPPFFKKPFPHVPIYKKPLPPVPVYEKPLPPPVPVYEKPLPPPVPVYVKPLPPPVPVYVKPLPPPVPVYKKPNPPPVPVYEKPLPPPVPVYEKPLPPPVYKKKPCPIYKKPLPPLPKFPPIYKKPLPPIPELPPVYKKPLPPLPYFPPIYKKPIPHFPPIYKKPLPHFPPIYKKPLPHFPPIYVKPLPPLPKIPHIYKKPCPPITIPKIHPKFFKHPAIPLLPPKA